MNTPTQMSIDGVVMLVGSEAIVPFRYKDSVQVDTFGVGHTKNAGGLNPASLPYGAEQSMELVFSTLQKDLKKFESRTTKAIKGTPTTQAQYDAMVHFDVNTGAIDRATWMESHRRHDYPSAAVQILNWSKPKEIIGRRKEEQALYRDGKYSLEKASVYPADSRGQILWAKGKKIDVRPIAEKLFAANQSDKAATQTRDTAATGATGGMMAEATNQASAPQSPIDVTVVHGWLDLVLTGILIIGVVTAGICLFLWLKHHKDKVKSIKEAARLTLQALQTEAENATDKILGRAHTSSIADGD